MSHCGTVYIDSSNMQLVQYYQHPSLEFRNRSTQTQMAYFCSSLTWSQDNADHQKASFRNDDITARVNVI